MGWIRCDLPDDLVSEHEGYLRAAVRDGFGWRFLGEGDVAQDVNHVVVACGCGWSSPRQFVLTAEWAPFCVFVDEATEDAAMSMWGEHVDTVTADTHRELARRAREMRSAAVLDRIGGR